MSDNHMLMQQQAAAADDGWNDAAQEAGERTIRGTLLKFADWRWTAGKENTPVEAGTEVGGAGDGGAVGALAEQQAR